jgi:1-acyl-sn-glycerol-3-phosphate acyltransferase
MSHVLSLLTLYEVAREVMPAFVETLVRDIDRDEVDRRLCEFADRVMARARIQLDIQGRERVPQDRSLVYMSNHQSHMDIPVLYASMPTRTVRMVAKSELFRIPFWNRVLRLAGFIEIDRGDREKAIASLDRAAEALGQGVSIYIAPEGSRSKTGRLGPLKKGGFHLARDANAPIVPVAISGTLELLPPGGTSMAYDRPVRVVFGDPIEVEGRGIDELMAEVEAFLKANKGKG